MSLFTVLKAAKLS